MATINVWKCDICKKELREGDAGYGNKRCIKIDIDMGHFEGTERFNYNDVCHSCRESIVSALQEEINKIIK